MTSWLTMHQFHIIIPLLVFITVALFGFGARWAIQRVFKKRQQRANWLHNLFLFETMWNAFVFWFIILGAYIAIEISVLPQTGKNFVGDGLASLFVISLMVTLIRWSGRVIGFYLGKNEATLSLNSVLLNIARTTVIVIGLLILVDIWGFPTFPITLVLIVVLLIVVFAFRNTLDNFVAWLEIAYGEHIKIGHLIKLGSGETGHVINISWTRTVMQTNEGNLVIVPNYLLMSNIIVSHGALRAETMANYIKMFSAPIKVLGLSETLSDREREVLKLIGSGATNREIAEQLIISEHTAKSHLRSIMNKLNLRNRQQAAVYAERMGLGKEPESQNRTL